MTTRRPQGSACYDSVEPHLDLRACIRGANSSWCRLHFPSGPGSPFAGSRSEEGKDRHDAAMIIRSLCEIELHHDVPDVGLDGP